MLAVGLSSSTCACTVDRVCCMPASVTWVPLKNRCVQRVGLRLMSCGVRPDEVCDDTKNAHASAPDTLRGAMATVRKRQSMTSSTSTAAGGTAAVPRSTSQPGNC